MVICGVLPLVVGRVEVENVAGDAGDEVGDVLVVRLAALAGDDGEQLQLHRARRRALDVLEKRAVDRGGVCVFVDGLDETREQVKIAVVVDLTAAAQAFELHPDGVAFFAVFVGVIVPPAAGTGAVAAVDKALRTGQRVQPRGEVAEVERRHVFDEVAAENIAVILDVVRDDAAAALLEGPADNAGARKEVGEDPPRHVAGDGADRLRQKVQQGVF